MSEQAIENSTYKENSRYTSIDALRGLAAVGVLFHHMLIKTVMSFRLQHPLPASVQVLGTYGANGVQIFFVLSGFVIAHSLRRNTLAKSDILKFILRRQIRLDLPYWSMICFTLLLQLMEMKAYPTTTEPLPNLGTILPNFIYLQFLTNRENIVDVSWTLCIEVQFYVVFIFLVCLGQKSFSKPLEEKISNKTKNLLCSSMLLSCLYFVAITWGQAKVGILAYHVRSSLFLYHWFYFSAGVLCYWVVRKQMKPSVFLYIGSIFAILILGSNFLSTSGSSKLITGLVTVIFLAYTGYSNNLTVWGRNKLLQYFGKISYSLYLVHISVISIILRFGYKITKGSEFASLGWFFLSGGVSILCAHLFWRYIELPSVQLSSKLKGSQSKTNAEQSSMPIAL